MKKSPASSRDRFTGCRFRKSERHASALDARFWILDDSRLARESYLSSIQYLASSIA
jgi:hypothetical protein